jgi:hypothetical protein
MKETLINYRLTIRAMPLGLIKLLLTLSLATASLPAFSATNLAPVISGMPPTSVLAGSSYYFRPTATDANGDRLRFSIANKPAWANFSSRTGRLSGTPGSGSVGTYSNIVISVSDWNTRARLPAFDIRVDAATVGTVNSEPVISGMPATSVLAGSAYSFQPTATDADADPLSFSISNKPAWASFSTTTGQLTGTPGTGGVGTYSNIVIAVTDGKASAGLPAFAIRVDATTVQTGSLTLSWEAPVTRADGTPLSLADINGYRIHYGKSAGDYTNHVDLADATAQQVTLTDLPLGTYHLVMTTYDVVGLESGYSSAVTKNVQ